MDTLSFLKTVLGDGEWYCAFGLPKVGKPKQKFYRTVEELHATIDDFKINQLDTYFGTASFKTGTSRKAENVENKKCFYVDIDCGLDEDGEPKNYATKEQGKTALQEFIKTSGLPSPIVVDSGGGYHAYWVLEHAVRRGQWQPVATQFKEFCLDNGLSIDLSVSADSARILRCPGTVNYKKEPRECKVVKSSYEPITDIDSFYEKIGGTNKAVDVFAQLEDVPEEFRQQANAMMEVLNRGVEHSFKKILEKTNAGTGCAQIKHIFEARKTLEEPMWRAGLSIAQFCTDKDKAIHAISKGHPEYDPDETELKARQIKGPYLCHTFNQFNPGLCENCPHFANKKISSPISLGRELQEATSDELVIAKDSNVAPQLDPNRVPAYPKPYFRKEGGGVCRVSIGLDDEKEELIIYHNDIYVTRRVRDAELGECVIINIITQHDGKQEVMMPLAALTSREEFRKLMSMAGVMLISPKQWEELMKYLHTWVNHLQAQARADDSHRQFGWTAGNKSFVVGAQEITPTEIKINHMSPPTGQYFDFMSGKGTIQDWKKAINTYNNSEMDIHQVVICAGFGSALMQFVPNIKSAGLHIYSEDSGFGKSWVVQAAMSIWGNQEGLMMKGKDTENSILHRCQVFKNLPLVLDEMTNVTPEQLSGIIMTMSDGLQKSRMMGGSNNERLRGEPWANIVLSNGNESMVERISTQRGVPKAEAQRMMEIEVTGFNFYKQDDGGRSASRSNEFAYYLNNNYGVAGPVFIDYVMKNEHQVRALIEKYQDAVIQKFTLSQQNRHWVAFCACCLTALAICKKLGLLDFETRNVLAGISKIVNFNKRTIDSLTRDPGDVLSDYVNEKWGDFIKVDSKKDLRSGIHKNALDDLTRTIDPKSVIGRYETDTEMLFIIPRHLKHWCLRQRMNYTQLTRGLERNYGMTRKKVHIAKGTKMDIAPIKVMVLDSKKFLQVEEDYDIDQIESGSGATDKENHEPEANIS